MNQTEHEQGIELRCQSCHGTSRFVTPELVEVQAAMIAGAIDGSSSIYATTPSPECPVGRCARCGGRYKAILFGYQSS
jgi:hypothetical protein